MSADLVARLSDDALHAILNQLAHSHSAGIIQLARCCKRLAQAAACVREDCIRIVFTALAPDAALWVTSPALGAYSAARGLTPAVSWDPILASWADRLLALHAERAVISRVGIARLWIHPSRDVPWPHLLRTCIARRLTCESRQALTTTEAFDGMLGLVEEHLLLAAKHGLPREKVVSQLPRTYSHLPFPLALVLELADHGRFLRLATTATFLRGALEKHDLERAYVNLLTVQGPLLSETVFLHLDSEFRATFDSSLKYGFENH